MIVVSMRAEFEPCECGAVPGQHVHVGEGEVVPREMFEREFGSFKKMVDDTAKYHKATMRTIAFRRFKLS